MFESVPLKMWCHDVLLLIINYRSASHHLKNRAESPMKGLYFHQFSIIFSLDPAQPQTGASPRMWGKKSSSWRETNNIYRPIHWKIQVQKEAFITVRDQRHPLQAFQWEGGFGTQHLLKTGPKGGFIFDSLYILGKINIPRVPGACLDRKQGADRNLLLVLPFIFAYWLELVFVFFSEH